MKNNISGRSMIEMIGFLVVVGLLGAGALWRMVRRWIAIV